MREKIGLGDDTTNMLVKMSEGNPGGLDVLMRMVVDDPMGLINVLSLDDMNIRGTQIWVGYKDFCNQDLKKFIECIKNRDADMVAKINKEGALGNHEEIAVTSGASFSR